MITHADRLHFTMATDPAELDQVHRINYRTFVEEIPQHAANDQGVLVDRFSHRSTCFVCKRGDRVIGMVTVHEHRPFSLDAKLADVDAYLPAGCRPCEIRLLAVEPGHRNGVVFRGLIRELARYCISRGFDLCVISGTLRQLKLYEHLGFVAFGPVVGTPDAPYQPMYLTLDAYRRAAAPVVERETKRPILRFLPGPVDLHPEVEAALARPAISHREDAFLDELRHTRAALCRLANARHVAILAGTGTLANDVVAMQLAALDQPGLILSNGEFGERLSDHAARAGLRFTTERIRWGEAFRGDAIAVALECHPAARWLWIVHHETSTGVLNDLRRAAALCADRAVALAVDCVSSLGLVPVDLDKVDFASAVSSKGIGSAAGLAIVFHRDTPRTFARMPRYLDLTSYASVAGVPFTLPSASLSGLRAASALILRRGESSQTVELSHFLRDGLRRLGLQLLAAEADACPGMVTLCLGTPEAAAEAGDALAREGIAVSYQSGYLRDRGWLQIALMGECSREKVSALLSALPRALR